MSSSWRTSPDTSGPRAKCETVIYEAFAKAAEIIVQSRCPLDGIDAAAIMSGNNKPSSSPRFNLHVPEIQDVRCVYCVVHVLYMGGIHYDSTATAMNVYAHSCVTYHPSLDHSSPHADHRYNDGEGRYMFHYDLTFITNMATNVNYSNDGV